PSTTDAGRTSSSTRGAARSPQGRRRCSATSSPSACCGCRGPAELPRPCERLQPPGCVGRRSCSTHAAPGAAAGRKAGPTAPGMRVAGDVHRRMAFIVFVLALMFFHHVKRRLRAAHRDAIDWADRHDDDHDRPPWEHWRTDWRRQWAEWNRHWAEQAQCHGDRHADWHRKWAAKMERHAERDRRRQERRARRHGRDEPGPPPATQDPLAPAPRRAGPETGFYVHFVTYLGVIGLLALINLMTTWYPWFLWPALGWGFGLFSHWMGVFGSRALKERYFDPAVERELQREKAVMQTEKQASLAELSSTIAHEIRNPIAAAKSLVQQMGEDPQSVENVEYAKVALDELDRVERRIAHLLKFAKEEDYVMAPANLAAVVDS